MICVIVNLTKIIFNSHKPSPFKGISSCFEKPLILAILAKFATRNDPIWPNLSKEHINTKTFKMTFCSYKYIQGNNDGRTDGPTDTRGSRPGSKNTKTFKMSERLCSVGYVLYERHIVINGSDKRVSLFILFTNLRILMMQRQILSLIYQNFPGNMHLDIFKICTFTLWV